jgi:hypothetical protein
VTAQGLCLGCAREQLHVGSPPSLQKDRLCMLYLVAFVAPDISLTLSTTAPAATAAFLSCRAEGTQWSCGVHDNDTDPFTAGSSKVLSLGLLNSC